MKMLTVHDIAALRAWRKGRAGRVAFVPTMGALHEGHLALVKTARQHADAVVTSIFVNPLQFGAGEDFSRYPRHAERDAALLQAVGCDVLFMPTPQVIYPQGQQEQTRIEVPGLSDVLCGASRPGHFVGVATVVAKLFNLVQPDVAVFGEKDFQQLSIIRRMVADLNFPVDIIGQATQREADGLAMSSRNAYLSSEERAKAPMLFAMLNALAMKIRAGSADFAQLEAEGSAQLQKACFVPDYVAIRHAEDLSEALDHSAPLVILAAARLGMTRLIDNLRV